MIAVDPVVCAAVEASGEVQLVEMTSQASFAQTYPLGSPLMARRQAKIGIPPRCGDHPQPGFVVRVSSIPRQRVSSMIVQSGQGFVEPATDYRHLQVMDQIAQTVAVRR
jgi:hypothetical protein